MKETLCIIFALMAFCNGIYPQSSESLGIRVLRMFSTVIAGALLPLFVFSFSAALAPNAKEGCSHGWLDCFHVGKLALSPLVVWATVALIAAEPSRRSPSKSAWVVLGLFLGMIVASVCFIFGVFESWDAIDLEILPFLLVPLYIATWHGIRWFQIAKTVPIRFRTYVVAFCSSVPFWVASLIWSYKSYQSLPETDNCFVATAAMRGHTEIVGPLAKIRRNGRVRVASRQMIILWRFEDLWRLRATASHAWFRRFYNRFGPIFARRITSPFLSDIVYLALKPVELLARCIESAAGETKSR